MIATNACATGYGKGAQFKAKANQQVISLVRARVNG